MAWTPSADAVTAAAAFVSKLADVSITAVDSYGPKALFDAFVATLGNLQRIWAVSAQSANFNAAVWTHYRVDTSGGNVTATLPVPGSSNAGMDISFKHVTDNGHNLILSAAASIDGAGTYTLTNLYDAVTVRSTGSTWDVIAVVP